MGLFSRKKKMLKRHGRFASEKVPNDGRRAYAPPEWFRGLDADRSVYTQGGMWGRNISVNGDKREKVVGHKCGYISGCWTPKPSENDYLRVHMRSKQYGMFQIVNVEYPGDPHDYFNADIIWLGYEDQMNTFDEEKFFFEKPK